MQLLVAKKPTDYTSIRSMVTMAHSGSIPELPHMSIFKKIIQWNSERGLLDKEYNHSNEISFILEEVLESYGLDVDRKILVNSMVDIIEDNSSKLEKVAAFADIIVFAIGSIAKLGYDPELFMEEVFKEINSRTGKLIDGKFVKDKDAVTYKADIDSCML